MKAIKKNLSYFLLGATLFAIPANIAALEVDIQQQPVAQTPVFSDNCAKELLTSYFPLPFVNQSLAKFNVPRDQWDAIDSDLAAKDKQVIQAVEEKAEKLATNPLKDASQRIAAGQLFRETVSKIFFETLKAHGVTDEKQIQAIFDDIHQQKRQAFALCQENRRNKVPAQQFQQQPQQPQQPQQQQQDQNVIRVQTYPNQAN